jgi:alpha,alpha-trehalase
MWSPFQKLKHELQSQLTIATTLAPPKASPDELLGELFADVQLRRMHADSKTFTDLVPVDALRKILKDYEQQRERPGFDLNEFIEQRFKSYLGSMDETGYASAQGQPVEEHINELWKILTRHAYRNNGSLIALPYTYVVPGGRFAEQFYWDSYFIMLGLAAANNYKPIDNMIKNYAFMIRKLGYIPTANRSYLLSRSQPPFFSHMVKLLADKRGKAVLIRYLPYMLAEYKFWTKGRKDLTPEAPAYRRIVRMPDGSVLNRYYDNKHTPRPEAYKEDVETAHSVSDRSASQVYTDIRAACESGWDFSSRWSKNIDDISSIHTTDIIPIDLNCLLVHLEETIADCYSLLKQPLLAKRFKTRAEERQAAIQKYCWNPSSGFYFDYDFVTGKQTECYSLAALYPLYTNVATQEQAAAVYSVLSENFLRAGGLVTTLMTTGQQWDAPNGWAPLQWISIVGLRNYGYNDFAEEVKRRWIGSNLAIYSTQAKLVEKYNVLDVTGGGGGGEYPLQDGFGWTNGVLLSLLTEDKDVR